MLDQLQGPIGTTTISHQCVSQKHGFLFLEKFLVCHKNVAFELCLTNQNFLTCTALSVTSQILSNFQKISSRHRWRTLQMPLDLEPTLKAMSGSSQIKILIHRNRVPL